MQYTLYSKVSEEVNRKCTSGALFYNFHPSLPSTQKLCCIMIVWKSCIKTKTSI